MANSSITFAHIATVHDIVNYEGGWHFDGLRKQYDLPEALRVCAVPYQIRTEAFGGEGLVLERYSYRLNEALPWVEHSALRPSIRSYSDPAPSWERDSALASACRQLLENYPGLLRSEDEIPPAAEEVPA